VDILISLVWLLIYLAVLFGAYYLIEWAIKKIFPEVPSRLMTIIMVIFVLIGVVLILMWLSNIIPGGGMPSFLPPRRN
jgi:amino acid transporter